MANILASSLDNFIVLNNSHSTEQPYVTFTVASPSDVIITIKDANNDDGYYKEISGNSTSVISQNSFKTSGVIALGLMECLKLNSIFYDISLEAANTVKAYIDTSIKYNIRLTKGSGITIGGTYSSYNPTSANKMVLMLQGKIDENTTNISLEKYNNSQTVSFNITSPFERAQTRVPITMKVTAYQVYDNVASMVTAPYSEITVLPTTLTKFQKVDYSNYYGSGKKHFLTNNESRNYNYGEYYGLSILSDSNPTFKKNYYTNSGVFLETQTNIEYTEHNGIRHDIYDKLDLDNIEARYNHQVGYVELYAIINGVESYPIRFNVMPKCDGNNTLFFLNELGGIDSFNFTNTKTTERSIDDLSTYFINPIRSFSDKYELQSVKQKKSEVTTTLSTHQVDKETAMWLGELNKSKYVFEYLGTTNPKYKIIVVDKFDIEYNTSEDEFELELEYHDGDNDVII